MPAEEGSLDNRKEACDSPTGQKEKKKEERRVIGEGVGSQAALRTLRPHNKWRTPGACGGVKWGQTSLSLRLGIKGILRTAVEQESPGPSLSRQVRNHGGRSSLKVVSSVAHISYPRKRRWLCAKPRQETKNSCQCCSPPRESVLGVRSLKPKPNQTVLEISTDFASVTGPRKLFLRPRDNKRMPL